MANFLDILKGEGPAIQIIRSLVNTPASATSIINTVRQSGYGIRTQTGFNVIAHLREVVAPATDYIKHVNLNAFPTIQRLPLSITKQLRNFAYNVEVTGVNKNTGEIQTKNVTISSNQLLTKQMAVDAAVSIADGSNRSYGVSGGSGQVVSVFQNSAGLVDDDVF